MKGARWVHAALGVVALLSFTASACVRLSDPELSCIKDPDCPDGQTCSFYRVCIEEGTCTVHRDCDDDQRCEDGRCAEGGCSSDAPDACGGRLCDESSRRCATGCSPPNVGCASGFVCREGACVVAQRLANGSVCVDGLDCFSGQCCTADGVKTCRQSCGLGGSCASAEDCAVGCCLVDGKSGICSAEGCGKVGATCAESADCDTGACVAGVCECVANEDCGSGFCTNGRCSTGLVGSVCDSDGQCQSGSCVAGYCACTADEDCSVGWCSAGECTTGPADVGHACVDDSDCVTGSCAGETCRGTAGAGADCAGNESICAAGRVCCQNPYNEAKYVCSEFNSGCDGANGDECVLGGADGCLSKICVASTMCSEPCVTHADCGTSPWGKANRCEINQSGDAICFPGCTSDADCDLLGDEFYCDSKGVCSGGFYTADDLRLY